MIRLFIYNSLLFKYGAFLFDFVKIKASEII